MWFQFPKKCSEIVHFADGTAEFHHFFVYLEQISVDPSATYSNVKLLICYAVLAPIPVFALVQKCWPHLLNCTTRNDITELWKSNWISPPPPELVVFKEFQVGTALIWAKSVRSCYQKLIPVNSSWPRLVFEIYLANFPCTSFIISRFKSLLQISCLD